MATHRWRGYGHPELYRMINSGPGPAASTPQTEYWEMLLRELGDVDLDLDAKLKTLGAGWRGAAGDGAQGALNPLRQWASDAQSGASGMRASTEYQADMIARARAEMPEPVEVTTQAPSGWQKFAAGAALLTGNAGPAMAVASQAADHEAQEAARDAAEQKAIDTMESYSSSSEFNRSTLGEFAPPPDVVISTPAPSGGTSASAAVFSGGGAAWTPGGSTGSAPSYTAPSPPAGGGSGYTPPSGGGGSVTPLAPSGGATPPAGQPPLTTTTTPSGYAPPTSPPIAPATAGPALPPTGSPAPSPTGGGAMPMPGPSRGVGGRPGLPFAPGAMEPESTRGNNAFRPGAGLAAEAVAGARGGVVGAVPAANARGSAGLGMAGPACARGESDDDREHGLADYLIETVDVFGDERTVSQPVIGDEPK